MADDIPGDPRETAARRLRMGEEDRASRRAAARAVEEGREANRRYARNQTATRIPPTPEGGTRPMETARATRIPMIPAEAGAAATGVGTALRGAARAAGPIGAALTVNEGLSRLGAQRDNSSERQAEDRRRFGSRGRAAGYYGGEAAQSRSNREETPSEDVTSLRNQRRAEPEAKKAPPRRPARARPSEPSADELNATELLNARERDRVSAYKTGGMVRGGGCEVRGKTRGRMT